MPKLKKSVVPKAGVYYVNRGGARKPEAITEDRLKRWAANGNEFLASGWKIPSPINHRDKNGKFPHPIILGDDGAALFDASTGQPIDWDASTNGGYIEKFEYSPEEGLTAVIDSPGDENDANTPAGKLNLTAKETSIFVKDSYTDGSGKTWKDLPCHVANVLYPIAGGQPDPKIVPEEALAFSMSDMVGYDPQRSTNTETKKNLQTLMDLLMSAAKVALPPDTKEENLMEKLIGALLQKQASNSESEEDRSQLTTRPPGSETRSPGVVMSDITPNTNQLADQVKDLQEEITSLKEQIKRADSFVASQLTDKKGLLKERINKLLKAGLPKKVAEERLLPQLESYSLTLSDLAEDGTPSGSPLEALLETLEAAFLGRQDFMLSNLTDSPEAPEASGTPWHAGSEYTTHQHPSDGDEPDVSDKDFESLMAEAGV